MHGELLSYVFFAGEFAEALIKLGQADAQRWIDQHPADLWQLDPLPAWNPAPNGDTHAFSSPQRTRAGLSQPRKSTPQSHSSGTRARLHSRAGPATPDGRRFSRLSSQAPEHSYWVARVVRHTPADPTASWEPTASAATTPLGRQARARDGLGRSDAFMAELQLLRSGLSAVDGLASNGAGCRYATRKGRLVAALNSAGSAASSDPPLLPRIARIGEPASPYYGATNRSRPR